jgi:hypothetical protein
MLKPYLATPAGRVMRPRTFRAALKELRAREDQNAQNVTGWDWYPVAPVVVLREARRALNARINDRAGLRVGTERANKRERDWLRDQREIQDYRARRIVCRGSGLRTPEARRAAPDVQERFTEAGR